VLRQLRRTNADDGSGRGSEIELSVFTLSYGKFMVGTLLISLYIYACTHHKFCFNVSCLRCIQRTRSNSTRVLVHSLDILSFQKNIGASLEVAVGDIKSINISMNDQLLLSYSPGHYSGLQPLPLRFKLAPSPPAASSLHTSIARGGAALQRSDLSQKLLRSANYVWTNTPH
jgi:hypothetical protein